MRYDHIICFAWLARIKRRRGSLVLFFFVFLSLILYDFFFKLSKIFPGVNIILYHSHGVCLQTIDLISCAW